GAHFSPVEDELFGGEGELHGISYFCMNRIIRNDGRDVKRFFGRAGGVEIWPCVATILDPNSGDSAPAGG
ncbi:MAG TPA: hypothetical protein VHM90_15635, partial [Phycisphaerae bacterium]|nr:hypothetical protein [Phycisphaerae bacterium]